MGSFAHVLLEKLGHEFGDFKAIAIGGIENIAVAFKLDRADHTHGLGDLLGRLDRDDAPFGFIQTARHIL